MLLKLKNLIPKNTPWLQWTGGLATALFMLVIGMMIGWISPYLPRLLAEDSPLPLTEEEVSWVVAVHSLGRFFGAILGAVSTHYLGSKNTLFMGLVPMAICWCSVIVANSVVWLLVARLTNGISLGVAVSCISLYLGEISSPGIRGTIISLAMLGQPFGILVGSILGTHLSLPNLAWVGFALTIVTILLFLCIPESPHTLIRKGKSKQAQKSIARYNPGANVEAEFESLRNFVSSLNPPTFVESLREFGKPHNMKSGFVVFALFMFCQASGLNFLTFYTEVILVKGRFDAIVPSTMVNILNLVGILAGLCSMSLADVCGRKILWNATSAGCCACLMLMGVYFALLEDGFDPAGSQWLLASGLIIWKVCAYVGVTNIPSIILGETFSPNTKSLAACVASASGSISAFTCSKSYHLIVTDLGETWVYWIHASLMAASVIFGLTLLPETKGKSLQEIQDMLAGKKPDEEIYNDDAPSSRSASVVAVVKL